MRPALFMVTFLALLAGLALAQPDERRAQVAAAAADASRRLEEQVLSSAVAPQLTVADLVQRTGSREALAETIRGADQVGGTRWIDDQTTQVSLELSGDAVARTLLTAAESHRNALPIPLDDLKLRLSSWKQRTFTATGTSTAATAADHIRPDPAQVAWRHVSEADRRQAVMSARRNAVSRILESIGAVSLSDRYRISDALSIPSVEQATSAWLMSRPVTSLEYRDDLEVRLMLAVQPKEFCVVLRDALSHDARPVVLDETGWNRFCEQVRSHMAPPIGRSLVVTPGTAPAAMVLPTDPPRWARDAIDTEAIARGRGPLLRTARAAEAAALDQMLSRVNALVLSPGLTVGDATREDPRIAAAVSRSMRRAKTFKVDYNDPEPGAVKVKVHLELDDVWRELNF